MQVQRRTDTLFGNTTVGRRELRRTQEIHQERLRNCVSALDTGAPRGYPRISHGKPGGGNGVEQKKQDAKVGDTAQAAVKARVCSRGTTPRKGARSLNEDARRLELDRIFRENQQLLRQIETSRPVHSVKDLLRRHQESRKYVINASHAMRLSGGYDQDLAELMKKRQQAAGRRPPMQRVVSEVIHGTASPQTRSQAGDARGVGKEKQAAPSSLQRPASAPVRRAVSAPFVSMHSTSSAPWVLMLSETKHRTTVQQRASSSSGLKRGNAASVGIGGKSQVAGVEAKPAAGMVDKGAIEVCKTISEGDDEEYNSDFADESKHGLSSSEAFTLDGQMRLSSPKSAKSDGEGGSYDDGAFYEDEESMTESANLQSRSSL